MWLHLEDEALGLAAELLLWAPLKTGSIPRYPQIIHIEFPSVSPTAFHIQSVVVWGVSFSTSSLTLEGCPSIAGSLNF